MKPLSPLTRKQAHTACTFAAIALAAALALYGCGQASSTVARQSAGSVGYGSQASGSAPEASGSKTEVDLSPEQLNAIKIESVGTHAFSVKKDAVGSIDFDGDLSVQVFPPYQGKILQTLVKLGEHVRKGQPLYTIDSPDLIQTESTLIGAAGTFEMTTKELARVKQLYTANAGISQKDYEQAVSDQQTAEGAFKAARDAVRVFGKTEAEIDRIVASRKVDPVLVVQSPISGQITSKSSAPGLFVQPGTAPAPYAVADLSIKWMLANVIESDVSLFHVGEPVEVRVMAYPDRVFRGKVSKIYATVDPSTHRETVRSEIADPGNELRPGMLASFSIEIEKPIRAIAIPLTGVVRNGDGTMVAWVTADRQRFFERFVKVGLQEDGRYQILAGLHQGELVITDGAIFLSNMLDERAD